MVSVGDGLSQVKPRLERQEEKGWTRADCVCGASLPSYGCCVTRSGPDLMEVLMSSMGSRVLVRSAMKRGFFNQHPPVSTKRGREEEEEIYLEV